MLLDIRHVCKRYPGADPARPVLSDVTLALEAGETLALTGESGSGKSTLLHLVGALDGFDSGEITLDGTALSGLEDTGRAALRRTVVALVFQQFNLIPSLTVAQNLSFHARLGERAEPGWIDELSTRLGLRELADRYPEQLSGGQQQRVAIGRALALRPKLLLADEPTGNLDEANGTAIMDLLFGLRDRHGATLVLVTHAPDLAARCDRVIRLRDGHINPETAQEAAE